MTVRVLIVDDSAFFRKRVTEILNSVSEIEVVGAATNGKEALDKVSTLKPDVITMDYEMPVMDGVTAVRHIMATCPTPIIMFSSLTYEGARVTLDALEAGAVDFLPKNFEDISRNASRMQEVLKERILQVARAKGVPASASSAKISVSVEPKKVQENSYPQRKEGTSSARPVKPSLQRELPSASRTNRTKAGKSIAHEVSLLVIGTSTGGPVALQKVIARLPSNFPLPILLVQHMPATFTPAFAERLNSMSALTVSQAVDGDLLTPGKVYLAPGGQQMVLKQDRRSARISIIESDARLTYKPSVDLTFGSASRVFPGKMLGIVLTGMGADGRDGSRLVKSSGATVWTQNEQSCVVYGMPKMVDDAGYSDLSLDINEIADRLVSEFL